MSEKEVAVKDMITKKIMSHLKKWENVDGKYSKETNYTEFIFISQNFYFTIIIGFDTFHLYIIFLILINIYLTY